MVRTYRYRVYPTKAQVVALEEQLAWAAALYNAALQERRDAWRLARRSIHFNEQSAELTEYRREGGQTPTGMAALVQHEVLRRVDRAFQAFYRRCKSGQKPGYPRWRAKDRYDSLTFGLTHDNTAGSGTLRDGALQLTGIGRLKVRWHRPLPEEAVAKTANVRRSCGKWYVSLGLELPEPAAASGGNRPAAGIDLGIHCWAVLVSEEPAVAAAVREDLAKAEVVAELDPRDGSAVLIRGPRAGRRSAKKVKRLQRALARCKRKSRRRQKAVARLAKAREHERLVRRDHVHKVSSVVVRHHGSVFVEDLNIAGMSTSARGTIEAPGRNVGAKSGLNREILDQGWYDIRQALTYKAEGAGRSVVGVPARNTSQMCSACGEVVRKPLACREHRCPECGHEADRDVNAAHNILRAGQVRRSATAADAVDRECSSDRQPPGCADVTLPEARDRGSRARSRSVGVTPWCGHQTPACP